MNSRPTLEIVDKYLNIVLVQNKHGKGLEDLLTEDFVFDDPFGRASSAREFLGNSQPWIDTPKSFRMERQFIDGDHVCSVYRIDVTTPSGGMAGVDVVDVVELRGNRIAKERVYFANPVQFAKDMGFLSAYVKPFGS